MANSSEIDTASSSDGIDSITSTIRITTVSTQPPNAPAVMPRINPPVSPIRVAKTPTSRVCRLPNTMREKKSRPNVSPPSGNPGCAGAIVLRALDVCRISNWAPGSCGAISGAKIANRTKETTMVAPTQKSGLTRRRFHASATMELPASSGCTAAVAARASILSRRPLP